MMPRIRLGCCVEAGVAASAPGWLGPFGRSEGLDPAGGGVPGWRCLPLEAGGVASGGAAGWGFCCAFRKGSFASEQITAAPRTQLGARRSRLNIFVDSLPSYLSAQQNPPLSETDGHVVFWV